MSSLKAFVCFVFVHGQPTFFSVYLHLSCVPIQLTEVKTIPTPAPRGEKVSSATHSRI